MHRYRIQTQAYTESIICPATLPNCSSDSSQQLCKTMNPQPLPAKSESWRVGSKHLGLSLPGDCWTATDLLFPVMVTDHDWFLTHFICTTRSETHLEAGWRPRPLNPLQCQPTQVGTMYTPNACSLEGIKFVLSCFSLFFFLILSSSCKAKLYFSKVSPIKKIYWEVFIFTKWE